MGGSSNKASREAQAAEAARQARIQNAVGQINAVYSAPQRDKEISDYQSAVQQFLGERLNRDKQQADRDVRFAMARNGLAGGSADVDANRALSEKYQEGVLEATRTAMGRGAQLRSQDQQAQQNLIALAQSGMDATTAAQQASESMRVNLANAKADMGQQTFGDMFSQFADLYKNSQEQKGKREAQKYGMAQGLYGGIGGYQ